MLLWAKYNPYAVLTPLQANQRTPSMLLYQRTAYRVLLQGRRRDFFNDLTTKTPQVESLIENNNFRNRTVIELTFIV